MLGSPCGRDQEHRPSCRAAGLLQESPRGHKEGLKTRRRAAQLGVHSRMCTYVRVCVHVCMCEEEGRATLFLYKPWKVNRINPSHPNHLTGGSVTPNRVIYHLYCHAFEELLGV